MGEKGNCIVLKWSNDIYAKTKCEEKDQLRKIGGILVNTAFISGGVKVVVGTYSISHGHSTHLSHRMRSQRSK